MSKRIDSQMEAKGYEKVTGMAIVGDVAVAETSREILSPVLSTQQAVNVFNNEFSNGWQLYRKRSIVHCERRNCDITTYAQTKDGPWPVHSVHTHLLSKG